METSFESILGDMFGIENSSYSYDELDMNSTESHIMYDDNYVSYSTEMVEVTALMAMESMVSMESDGDNIIVKFFKFIGKIVGKIIELIGRFFKWIGNLIASIFGGGKADKMAKKQETVESISKQAIKDIEAQDKMFEIMHKKDMDDAIKQKESLKKVMNVIGKSIDDASKMNSKLDISKLDTINDITSSMKEIKATFLYYDLDPKKKEKDLENEKSVRNRVIDTNLVSYLTHINDYATNNKGELEGIRKLLSANKDDVKKIQTWLTTFNKSIDTGLKVAENLEIKTTTNGYNSLKELNRLLIELCQSVIGSKNESTKVLLKNMKEVERINSYILKIAESEGLLSSDVVRKLDDSNAHLLAHDRKGTIHF